MTTGIRVLRPRTTEPDYERTYRDAIDAANAHYYATVIAAKAVWTRAHKRTFEQSYNAGAKYDAAREAAHSDHRDARHAAEEAYGDAYYADRHRDAARNG